MSASAPMVDIINLSKEFRSDHGTTLAIDQLNLAVEEGSFTCVVGSSGCGKSTLMLIAAGLESATNGSIKVDGSLVERPSSDLGIVFQRDLLLEWRTTLDNVLMPFELRGEPREPHRERALDLLRMVRVAPFADYLPRQLSGGMRQRVAICRALATRPSILLMDEPFGALDAITRDRLNVDLAHICESQSTTVLFITHSIEEAVFLGDRVVVMSPRPGRIVDDLCVSIERPRGPQVLDTPEFASCVRHLRTVLREQGVLAS